MMSKTAHPHCDVCSKLLTFQIRPPRFHPTYAAHGPVSALSHAQLSMQRHGSACRPEALALDRAYSVRSFRFALFASHASLRDGKMIDAIKEFRVAYGSGLKEAEGAVEAMKAAFMPNGGPSFTPPPAA